MKSLVAAAFAALLAASCANDAAPAANGVFRYSPERDHVGRIYHYVRSNRDGALPEDVYVFHRSANEVETYKSVSRCTNAAFVTAELDRNIWSSRRLVGGRLGREANQIGFATLTLDEAAKRLDAKVDLPDGALEQSLQLQSLPWFLYDFDFSDLTIFAQHLADYKKDFSIETALVWTDPAAENFLQRLGEMHAIAEGRDAGRNAWRFLLSGEAFKEGSLLLDAKDGHIVEVESNVPNHAEYNDFKLSLVSVDDGGDSAWRALLLAHFEGCPPASE